MVHLGKHLMDAQLDATGRRHPGHHDAEDGDQHPPARPTTEILGGDGPVTGLAFKDGTTLDCDMVVISAGIKPNAEIGHSAGLTVERAIVVDNHMRSVDDMNVYVVGECAQHRGKVYGLVAPLWEQAKVFAEQITRHNPRRRLPRLQARHQAQGDGRRARLHGHHRGDGGARRDRSVHRGQARHLQEADRARRPPGRRHPDGRHQQGRLPDAERSTRTVRCRTSGSACCSTWARRRRR